MENFVTLLIPALLAVLMVRLLMVPMKLLCKLAIHIGCGFLCLWILNTIGDYTGILFPINAVTSLTAGTLGLPGIAILALLAVL